MQTQYKDNTKHMARVMLHVKYNPPGKPWSPASPGIIAAGDRVLDIGCGPGRFWSAAAQSLPAGLDLTLADLSPGMVDEALASVTAAGGSWRAVTGQVADVCALPFAADSFDVVTAMHMLYHASDPDRAIGEIARVLKPAGKLLVTTNGAETMTELNQLSHVVLGTPPYDFGSAPFSLESGEPILRKYFQKVEVRQMTDILRVTDAMDVVNFLTSFPPGEDADAATLEHLDGELAARMVAQGGVFPITRIAGYMIAEGRTSVSPG